MIYRFLVVVICCCYLFEFKGMFLTFSILTMYTFVLNIIDSKDFVVTSDERNFCKVM